MMGIPAPLQIDPSTMYEQQQQPLHPHGMQPHPHQPVGYPFFSNSKNCFKKYSVIVTIVPTNPLTNQRDPK
jgi:hypothetical protein